MTDFPTEHKALCLAVGKLMLDFAELENAISAGLRLHLAFRLEGKDDVDPLGIAAAVYGSMRLRTSTMIMRRLMVQEQALDEELALFDAVFDHIGHINTFRDKLAHQSLSSYKSRPIGVWELSDFLTTRQMDRLLSYEFQTSDVDDAAHDVRAARKTTRHYLPHPGIIRSEILPQLPAWRYKPASLKLVRPGHHRAPQ